MIGIREILLMALPLIFALTVVVGARALVADRMGDHSARAQGRLTLNPTPHIDLIGTVFVPLAVLLASQGRFIFGWPKPLPLQLNACKKPRLAQRYVSLAGIVTHLAMAIAWALLINLAALLPKQYAVALVQMCSYGVMFNGFFLFFNLLPLPPFDMGYLIDSFLGYKAHSKYMTVEPYSFWIVLLLLLTGVLSPLFMGVAAATNAVASLFIFI